MSWCTAAAGFAAFWLPGLAGRPIVAILPHTIDVDFFSSFFQEAVAWAGTVR
jgi:hypothetical protein